MCTLARISKCSWMKQGLSLRVSQHLALTPQLQQSIRLLQLSTLELSQEVDQMLDENPFLEMAEERAEREDFGVDQADTPVSVGEREMEFAPNLVADYATSTSASSTNEDETTPLSSSDEPNWEGDGTTEMTPDDGEWGVDAKARANNLGDDEDKDATELAGRTECNRVVNFPGGPNMDRLIGQMADVRITQGLSHSLRGELVIKD